MDGKAGIRENIRDSDLFKHYKEQKNKI